MAYKHLIYTNPILQAQDKEIRQALKTKYEDMVYKLDDKTFWTETRTAMLSWSTFSKEIVRVKLMKIPEKVLNEARVLGVEFMTYLQEMWVKRITDLDKINYLSENLRRMFLFFIQWMIDNNWEIRGIEKYVANGYWHGFIDMVVRDEKFHLAPVEIKTRSDNKIRTSDIVQLAIYTHLLGPNVRYGYVVVVNRKTLQINKYKVGMREASKYIETINDMLKIVDMDKYCFVSKIKPRSPKKEK